MEIPYLDEAGTKVATRYRLSLEGDKFRWKQGAKPPLYGLWQLSEARRAGYCVLVEGESDAHVLRYHDIPCVAIPGAAAWSEAWASHLVGIEKIYVVVEPDHGGETVVRWLSKSQIRNRARLVRLPAKDPSALYLDNAQNFLTAWRASLEVAQPWSEVALDAVALRQLEGRIKTRREGSLTPYQLAHGGPRRYRGRVERAEAALQALVTAGVGRWEERCSGPRGGRPSRRFVLNSGSGGVGNAPALALQTCHEPGVENPIGGDGYPAADRNGEVSNAKCLRIREGRSLASKTDTTESRMVVVPPTHSAPRKRKQGGERVGGSAGDAASGMQSKLLAARGWEPAGRVAWPDGPVDRPAGRRLGPRVDRPEPLPQASLFRPAGVDSD